MYIKLKFESTYILLIYNFLVLNIFLSPRAAYHPEFPTVLTALEIDNAVVANSLIDMRSIETVLLIKVR